jgi:hypothetical protein
MAGAGGEARGKHICAGDILTHGVYRIGAGWACRAKPERGNSVGDVPPTRRCSFPPNGIFIKKYKGITVESVRNGTTGAVFC